MGRIAGIAAGLALWLGACAGRQPAPESPPRSVALPPQPTTASPAPLAPSEASTPGTRELVRELEQAERSAEPTQRWNQTRRILAAIRALSDPREGDLEGGRLFRFVRNARALTSLARGQAPVDFALRGLTGHLADVQYDSGPRSLTRVVLRKRLYDLARSGPDREAALDTLEVCAERGVLLALATGSDATAKRAAEAAARLSPVEPR
ncbi:MAG: hypothetical protein IPM35_40930 [Myxococcales bacterium]|nr:hypothetical protein [Myxococcales bacterium]